MTPLRILPNIEALTVGFLRNDPDLAALVGQRVYAGALPDTTRPCIRVTRWGGTPQYDAWQPSPILLDNAHLQIDVWGTTNAEAGRIAETVRAILAQRYPGHQQQGLEAADIVKVAFSTLSDSPDDTYDPPWPRYIIDLTITYKNKEKDNVRVR